MERSPLIAIVGETATGKSALAIELAEKFNGEIIAADSRTLYRGMDIGTAKPTLEEQKVIKHSLIDIADPSDVVTVAEFKSLANKAIKDTITRGKVPFLVGGSGLYVDAVVFDFSFLDKPDQKLRDQFRSADVQVLQRELLSRNIPLPRNADNARHLMRRLETQGRIPERKKLQTNTLMIGVRQDDTLRQHRITARIDIMLQRGLEAEVRGLVRRYTNQCPALCSIGYQEFLPYITGNSVTYDDVRMKIIHHTMQYAKRQRTWFRRNKSIHWVDNKEQAVDLITTFLNKVYTV